MKKQPDNTILVICDKCGKSYFIDVNEFDINKKCEGCNEKTN